MISSNPGINSNALTVGITLCIPTSSFSSYNLNSGCTHYTLKENETFKSLSNGNEALIKYLEFLNPALNPNANLVGQTICIPSCYYSSFNFKSTQTTPIATTTRKVITFTTPHSIKK